MIARLRRLLRERPHDDQGGITTEVVILAPLLVLLLLFVVYCGRLVSAKLDVSSAARSAARAASLARTKQGARLQAIEAVTGTLATHSRACGNPEITVDTSDMRPGGTVTVEITCTVVVTDLFPAAVGNKRMQAVSTSPVDTYRGAP